MAISEYKNGHFEEIRAWLKILEIGSNSTIFYLTLDNHAHAFVVRTKKKRKGSKNLSKFKEVIAVSSCTCC